MAPRTTRRRRPAPRQPDTNDSGNPSGGNRHKPDVEPSAAGSNTAERDGSRGSQQLVAVVLGERMRVTPPGDPQPDRAWTPEPTPYHAATYAAWGRKHFGDDWYNQRELMLRERNFHRIYDAVYKERQRALRVMEHQIEGRPFQPSSGVRDENWKRRWAEISKDMSIHTPSTPESFRERDDDTDLSGYDTYPPTPERREETPCPEDPWEGLEWERRRFHYDEEEYQFARFFLKERLIDEERAAREDEPGNKKRLEALEEIEKVKYMPGTAITTDDYYRKKRYFQLRVEGWTQEQVDAEEEEYQRQARSQWEEFKRKEQEERRKDSTDGQAQDGMESPQQGSPAQPPRDASRKVRRGRVTKGAAQSKGRKAAQSTSASTQPPPTGSRRRPKPDAAQPPPQPQRQSRRIAGRAPEFGLLPAQGEAPSLPEVPGQLASKAKAPAAGRGQQVKKASGGSKGAKPEGVSKPRKAGKGRLKQR